LVCDFFARTNIIFTMEIQPARKFQSLSIARLIMMAMTDDCCRHFIGPANTLDDFEKVMTDLVLVDHSQYSYTNTLVAIGEDGGICGACVSYDGGKLHKLRQPFINAAKENFGRDFSDIGDETQAGELYIDSLAVYEWSRGKGVATELLNAAKDKARSLGLPTVGLLVDKSNRKAEQLYKKVGFKQVGLSSWGGHAMKHLQYTLTE